MQYVLEVRSKDPGMGGRKLWEMFRRDMGMGIYVGRDCFAAILRAKGLNLRMRVRVPRTTDSSHFLPTYPDLVREYIPGAPDKLIVCDITYITIWVDEYTYTFCYLSLVLDAYTKEITGWSLGDTLEARYPLEALNMALSYIEENGGSLKGLIHHSDRGSQYASYEYTNLLKANKVRISMTESGDPKDNAQAERINNTMKNELLKGMVFRNVKEVRRAVEKMENSIQNIILQEMERLEGIMIATTNLATNLDKAFERRFIYKIEFGKPSLEAKCSIWRSMIPHLGMEAARKLAGDYDFSGGQIENIARKRAVEMVLTGKEPSLEQFDAYCKQESLNTGKRAKIGF